MTTPFPHRRTTTLHRLRRHQFLTLERARDLCLRAERGTLWVTVDGDVADIEIDAGERRVFDGPATVVVGTLGGDAVLSVSRIDPLTWTERFLGGLGLPARRALA